MTPRHGSGQPIFDHLQRSGNVSDDAMFETFNMGIGFCLMTRPTHVDDVMNHVARHEPTVIGSVVEGPTRVQLQ